MAHLAGVLAMAGATAGSAAPAPALPAAGARSWTLENGLALIVKEDRSAPVASVQAWVRTGSIDEGRHMGAGLSHILEHMLFKGTETRGANEIARGIQDWGGYINAYTSFDRTVYWIDIPSKGASAAVEILADAMMNSTLPEAEYAKEQEVIRREFAMGLDDPDRQASLKLFATAFAEHPYRHPVIGYLEVYNRLTRDDVLAYYRERYVPNNMFFVVAGDVDGDAIHRQLRDFFGRFPRRALGPVYVPAEPPQLGRRDDHSEFRTEHTRLEMAWHIPPVTHPDVPALDLLATALGEGRSSRLFRDVREKKGLAHSISAFSYTARDGGLFGVGAVLDPDKRAAVEAEVLAAVADVAAKGLADGEIEKAKKRALARELQTRTTARGVASDLGSSWLLTRNLDFSRDYLEAVRRVTAADIRRVAATYLRDTNLSVASLNPPGSLAAAGGNGSSAPGADVRRFELPNGLRLLVREDRRLPLVSVSAVFRAGVLAETEAQGGITPLASQMLLKGTGRRTAEEIASEVESVGGSIGAEGGNNTLRVALEVMRSDLPLGLDVLADVLLDARMPDAAVAREKEIQLAAIKAEEDQMTAVARNLMRRTLFPGHPYGRRNLGSPESVAGLDRAALLAFAREHLVARNGVVAVFGDVDAEEVRALVERSLGKMPAGDLRLADPPQPPPLERSVSVEEHKEKTQAVLMVGYRGAGLADPDRYALELIDEASSDLGSRFFVRIREEMGLAYFVGSGFAPGPVPGPFVFFLGTSPARVAEVEKAFTDEIRNLAERGLTPEEFARAKEKYLGQLEIRNQSNAALAFACAADELFGLGFDHFRRLRPKIEALTLEEVNGVARKYFAGKPAVTALVRPAPAKQAESPPAAAGAPAGAGGADR